MCHMLEKGTWQAEVTQWKETLHVQELFFSLTVVKESGVCS